MSLNARPFVKAKLNKFANEFGDEFLITFLIANL